MARSIQILLVLLLLALASVVSAQTPLTCGIVDIDGPSKVEPGRPLVLKVRTAGMLHTTKPEFKWKLSVGTITQGQGTDEVTVDTVGLGGQALTVTVELSGATLACNGSASRTMHIEVPPIACGLGFDGYGDIKFKNEKARLDNFAIQLLNDPLSTGYILMAAGQETFQNEAAERLDRAKSYLVDERGIDRNRVITIDCGFTQELNIKLFIGPLEAPSPTCSIFMDLPLYQVKFTKPRPKS